MDLSLLNKKVVTCGSTDGIGRASALLMAERGASITLVARDKDKLNNTLSTLSTRENQKHFILCVDFNNTEELKIKINEHINEKRDTKKT